MKSKGRIDFKIRRTNCKIENRNKLKRSATALVLMMFLASLLFACVPFGKAQSAGPSIPTYAFMAISPNPAGVGQQVTVLMWLDKINPTSNGPLGSRWQNYALAITKPDGTTANLGPFTPDDAAYAYATYTPDQTGTYTLVFSFPGQQVNGIGGMIPVPIHAYYAPSNYTVTLTVQQQQIAPSPQTPIPSGFWTRPVNAQNQLWYTISGNWLGIGGTAFGATSMNLTGNLNPYTTAPHSAHIIWTKPMDFGGLVGGEFGGAADSNYYTGKTYEPKFTPPVIINGVLYYNSPDPPKEGFFAVDLRTGKTLWWVNSTGASTLINSAILGSMGYPGISCGQILSYHSPNQEGSLPYLWYMAAAAPSGTGISNAQVGVQYYMYDANNGNLIVTFNGAPTGGTKVEGPSGELLIYFMGDNWVAMWNSTRAVANSVFAAFGTSLWTWRPPTGSSLNWATGLQWNVTVPATPGQAISSINSGVILATTGNIILPQNWQIEVGYDASTGKQLWVQNRTTPPGATAFGLMGPMTDGVYTEFYKNTMQWYGYSVYTGQQVWGPSTAYTNAWGTEQLSSDSGYGIVFGKAIDGIHALSVTSGQRLWDFYADDSGVNFPGFSTYPFEGGSLTIADGLVFAPTGNSHSDPLFRGAELYAIDANSGKQVWSINGFFEDTMPIADGILVGFNGYDNQLYAFAKGQSATTVQATPGTGNAITIQGTVTDQSTGQTCLGTPAAGTPAVSDDSMSAWMEYLYMQQPMPSNVKGVMVSLSAVDSSGNSVNIGTVTTDSSGHFGLKWTPTATGYYTVKASFDGTNSYYSSDSETGIAVGSTASGASASPSQAPQPTAGVSTSVYIAIAAVVIILSVVIAAIVLRRRK